MQTSIVTSLDDIPATDWDALVTDGYPFLQHAFLAGLERHGCLGERSGWHPMHLLCHDAGGRLLGAVPMYLKENSFGEFVFDWSWADAYRRHGLDYYPKLVAAIPFTPATGTRLLLTGSAGAEAVAARLIEAARALAIDHGCSSLHWLFTTPADQSRLQAGGFLTRLGCQFHWHNAGYEDFDHFLAGLTAKKRKNIRRERRQVEDADLRIRVVHGDEASDAEWRLLHQLYRDTFSKYGNFPALTLPFFRHVGAVLGRRVVLMIAQRDTTDVAVALSYASDSTLYGRHWGCLGEFDSLHFELCYYQGIDYCIRNGLQRFEPGAQGEHKIWRGFLPVLTRSAHWLAHPAFNAAVSDFLARERPAVQDYARQLSEHTPYRKSE